MEPEGKNMSIIVKGMEKPKSCLACDFCNPFTEKPYCRRLMKVTPKTATLPDCPLVEVPPHGRLIDADALKAWFVEWYDLSADLEIIHFLEILSEEDSTPTVIPADKDGET